MLDGVSDLIVALRRLKLLPDDRLGEAARDEAGGSARDAADALVRRGWLTAYQADELCEGRGAGLVVNDYVLVEKIGEGGMGEVFRAWDRANRRDAALKRISARRMGAGWAEPRFRREVEAASRLSHPNVVRVYDAGKVRDAHFLAMELLRGENLAEHLRRRGPLPVAEAVDFVRQACVGMQHAHEQGLVHRDLKPANLMLCDGPVVKVLDLGLALVSDVSTMTLTGEFFGTPDYVAPEQVADSHLVDGRADVYSLGCTLYHLLAGVPPFHEVHPVARAGMHQTTEPKRLEERRADVPPGVAEVVRKMMAKSPDGRYATLREAADVLAATLPRPAVTPAVAPNSAEQSPAAAWPNRPAGPAKEQSPDRFTNCIGMEFVLVPPGTFWMGATKALDEEAWENEGPRHKVKITKAYWMGVHPVTQGQWKAVMGTNPSWFCATGGGGEKVQGLDTDEFPVESVSWEDVQEFSKGLRALANGGGRDDDYRLPTEAEWEYSCRDADGYQKFSFGDSLTPGQANFARSLARTSKVGSYPANARGLYDMHGNVWEWCADWFGPYAEGEAADPQGPPSGPGRVRRGGSWSWLRRYCRAASRVRGAPDDRYFAMGFRLAASAE